MDLELPLITSDPLHYPRMAEIEAQLESVDLNGAFPVVPDSLPQDDPPVIVSLDVSFSREWNGAELHVSSEAQDDVGVDHIKISILEDYIGETRVASQFCNGITPLVRLPIPSMSQMGAGSFLRQPLILLVRPLCPISTNTRCLGERMRICLRLPTKGR